MRESGYYWVKSTILGSLIQEADRKPLIAYYYKGAARPWTCCFNDGVSCKEESYKVISEIILPPINK